jgi:hypothetical protein
MLNSRVPTRVVTTVLLALDIITQRRGDIPSDCSISVDLRPKVKKV